MRRLTTGVGVALIWGAIIAFGWLFSCFVETVLNPLLPGDWRERLGGALLFVGVLYLLWQVDNLKRDVRSLKARVDRRIRLIGQAQAKAGSWVRFFQTGKKRTPRRGRGVLRARPSGEGHAGPSGGDDRWCEDHSPMARTCLFRAEQAALEFGGGIKHRGAASRLTFGHTLSCAPLRRRRAQHQAPGQEHPHRHLQVARIATALHREDRLRDRVRYSFS